MAHIFNKKKHSDITVTVSGGDEDHFQEETFFLHKFPLISKSLYFDGTYDLMELFYPYVWCDLTHFHLYAEHIPEKAESSAPLNLKITEFPGGPRTFETVTK